MSDNSRPQAAPTSPSPTGPLTPPTFQEAFKFWLKLGFISFGGPTGQIAIMHAELVEKRRWISDNRFLHALNFCMLLPGPEAQQLAVYIGWLLHRTWGGIVAGTLFVLPSMFILWMLSFVYVRYGAVPWVAAILYGLKPAVLAIVAIAVVRIGKKALKNWVMITLAACAFVAIYFFKWPFPLIVFGAALIGMVGGIFWKERFVVIGHHQKTSSREPVTVIDDDSVSPPHARPTLPRAMRVCVVCLLLWFTPVILLGLWLGWNHTIVREGFFFSKAAMVTFGGAYAVLPYVTQQAVENYQWLGPDQMLDGLGLAETTPGPLIMVLQFVGFLGGWNHPGSLPPLLAATLAAFITTWTTFVPCFLWIFVGAPHIEQLRGKTTLSSALSAVTAAVVGVILNLAVWFGWHMLFPTGNQVDWFALAVTSIGVIGMYRYNWGVIPVVLGGGIAGLLYRFVMPAVI